MAGMANAYVPEACRFCLHEIGKHNNIEGCPFCTCGATVSEGTSHVSGWERRQILEPWETHRDHKLMHNTAKAIQINDETILAGAKAIATMSLAVTSGDAWDHYAEETQRYFLRQAKAVLEAARDA